LELQRGALGYDEGQTLDKIKVEGRVTSMAMNSLEDKISFVTDNNQLMGANIALDSNEEVEFKYLHAKYHSGPVVGLDVCLRKQLLATCCNKQIKIWNYATKELEIDYACAASDEMWALAIHPSGFHLVVAFSDKICMMNILSSQIKEFH
jgi:cilia- and flagella-associated protein 57